MLDSRSYKRSLEIIVDHNCSTDAKKTEANRSIFLVVTHILGAVYANREIGSCCPLKRHVLVSLAQCFSKLKSQGPFREEVRYCPWS